MPRYIYKCNKCEDIQTVLHGIDEKYINCAICKEQDCMEKLLSKPLIINKKQDKFESKIGEITNEYIEENRKILKQIKKGLKEDEPI